MIKRFLFLVLFLLAHFASQSQHDFRITEVPVFKSADDSIAYANAQATFQKIVAGQLKNLPSDSVMNQMRMITERGVIGRRKIYHASQNFFPFDSHVVAR